MRKDQNPMALRSSNICLHFNGIRAMSEGKKLVIENQSPYYLHSSKGLEVAIISVIFYAKNYNLWKKAIRIAMKLKNKLGFI